jgi:drug/metabolite transporter (DMT)-like permease
MTEKQVFTNKYSVPLLAILACILWGSALPLIKISYQELGISVDDFFSKILFASYRFFISAIMIFILIILTRGWKILKLNRKNMSYLFLLGFMQTTLQYLFIFNGLARTTGVKASILITLSIFLIVAISHFIYSNDRLTGTRVVGMILGFAGVLVVNLYRGSIGFSFSFLGEGFIIMGSITAAFSFIMAKKMVDRLDPILITAYQMFLGSTVLFLLAVSGRGSLSLNFNLKSLIIILYLSIVAAAAFTLWYLLIKYNPLGYLSIYRFVIPVSGVIFSIFFLAEESLSINVLIALILVSSGVIMINCQKRDTIKYEGEFY